MKKFILILSVFITSLFANDTLKVFVYDIEDTSHIIEVNGTNSSIKQNSLKFSMYESVNTSLNIEDIKKLDASFKPFTKDEKFDKKGSSYWIKVTFTKEFQDGHYIVNYGDMDFDLNSFSPAQSMRKFIFAGVKHIEFSYQKNRDDTRNYFRLLKTEKNEYRFLSIQTYESFFKKIDDGFIYFVFAGLALGIILMAALYNGAIYYYNREKSFLYYALMQVSIVLVLLYGLGVMQLVSALSFINSHENYAFISLIAALFATLFTRSFFNTSSYTSKLDIVLLAYITLILLDMVLINIDIINKYKLFSIAGLFYLVIGYIRYRQGFKPALFYLVGWSALILSVMLLEYFSTTTVFNPMMVGSTTEAILLSFALAYKMKILQDEKQEQKELMIQQSKLASMGEMIGNIAHQWRQPLTRLSYIFMNIEELADKNERSKKAEEGTKQLEFMSQTIDDFRDFYAPNKAKEDFSILKETKNVLDMLNYENIEFIVKEDLTILNYKNEYKQVVLNILTNAKDALAEREIKEPKITIIINKNIITIEDNAGGIEEENLQKIFEPYFTTKEKNSGIGLYMAKMIIEKNMGGELNVKNSDKGAVFEIIL